MKPKIAISIGDLNGIGIEIALRTHDKISQYCTPIYCISNKMLKRAASELKLEIPKDFITTKVKGEHEIKPGVVTRKAGKYSFDSFMEAITLADKGEVDAVCTLPINKESWSKADLKYKGHTEVLRDYFGKNAIMMLGCKKMFVGLFTEHIPLRKVAKKVNEEDLTQFLIDFYKNVKAKNIGVLGLNPHASDNGVLGEEEVEIFKAIKNANKSLEKEVFKGPLVPDTAFSPMSRKNYKYFVAMYQDLGHGTLQQNIYSCNVP